MCVRHNIGTTTNCWCSLIIHSLDLCFPWTSRFFWSLSTLWQPWPIFNYQNYIVTKPMSKETWESPTVTGWDGNRKCFSLICHEPDHVHETSVAELLQDTREWLRYFSYARCCRSKWCLCSTHQLGSGLIAQLHASPAAGAHRFRLNL